MPDSKSVPIKPESGGVRGDASASSETGPVGRAEGKTDASPLKVVKKPRVV